MAINLALDEARRGRRRWAFSPRPTASFEADLVDRLTLNAALCRLPARQREALGLRYFADLKDDAIAEVMSVSPGTVKVHLHRGIEALSGLSGLLSPEAPDALQ